MSLESARLFVEKFKSDKELQEKISEKIMENIIIPEANESGFEVTNEELSLEEMALVAGAGQPSWGRASWNIGTKSGGHPSWDGGRQE